MLTRFATTIVMTVTLTMCASDTVQYDPVGNWAGMLSIRRTNLRLVFHIERSEDGYTATITSLDQGRFPIPTYISVRGNSLTFRVEDLDVEYFAKISGNQIVGTFYQYGLSMRGFTLTRIE